VKGYNREIIQYRNNNTISMFRMCGERIKRLRESKTMESEGMYRKTVRRLGKELIAAKKDLECLQTKHLVLEGESKLSNKFRSIVTKKELEEASIKLTLTKKMLEEFGINKSDIDMLMK